MRLLMKGIKMNSNLSFIKDFKTNGNLLAVLIDPDKFNVHKINVFFNKLPEEVTHLFIGGSTVENEITNQIVLELKKHTRLPLILFPGDICQISNEADGLLFLTLLSGRNPEYLIGQQIKSVPILRKSSIEIISTGYILIDGGTVSSVERVTNTAPIPQDHVQEIVDTAKAGELLGNKLLYLEAGSGAKTPVHQNIIKAVKKEVAIPIIVGGGIRTDEQKKEAYLAGATMVVMGTAFEEK